MARDIIVFLGPTLRRDHAASLLDATYLPPVEQGSLVRAARDLRPRAVVLIDGAFARVPAIRHKEILWTLARGIPVFGASSMGALRAAEMGSVGMQGHGFVYRWYRATPLADDDEVAVAMTPAEIGAEPLSEALIDIRLTLRAARRAGIIDEPLCRTLEEAARATYFIDRLYPRIIAGAREAGPGDEAALDRLERWVPAHAVYQKRADAISLLERLAACPELLRAPPLRPAFRMTEAFAHDLDAAGLLSDDFAEFDQAGAGGSTQR